MHELINLARIGAITIGIAVAVWFGARALMILAERLAKWIKRMIEKNIPETPTGRRTFPWIAWGLVALVLAMIALLWLSNMARG